jgi:glycolate oxidase
MGLSDNALQALTEVLGEEYISTDPAVMRAYSKNFTSIGIRPPACVALPGKMEDIQEIYRLANRFDFKVIPTGSHLFMSCEPMIPIYDYLTIDPKRMDGVRIDEENMYAVVEPYATFGRLQVEAMKHGLTCYIPTGLPHGRAPAWCRIPLDARHGVGVARW